MEQIKTLSRNQKKRILQWEIPHLISLLKKEYGISTMYLISSALFTAVHKTNWLVFDGKTGFPVFVGEKPIGVFICFSTLNHCQAQQIRKYINMYFEKVFLRCMSDADSEPLKSFELNKLSLPDFAFSSERDFYFFFDEKRKTKKVTSKENRFVFPLLLKQGKKEDLLKKAHELYLNTSSFAFLNTEDLNWKKGVFQEMSGVFVCVPFFHQLSSLQKKILSQDLLKNQLSCRLVMGVRKKEELPEEWKDLFSCVL